MKVTTFKKLTMLVFQRKCSNWQPPAAPYDKVSFSHPGLFKNSDFWVLFWNNIWKYQLNSQETSNIAEQARWIHFNCISLKIRWENTAINPSSSSGYFKTCLSPCYYNNIFVLQGVPASSIPGINWKSYLLVGYVQKGSCFFAPDEYYLP